MLGELDNDSKDCKDLDPSLRAIRNSLNERQHLSKAIFFEYDHNVDVSKTNELAMAIKRYINITPKKDRETLAFIQEVRKKIFLLYKFFKFEDRGKPYIPKELSILLSRYVVLEGEVLAKKEYKDSFYKKNAENRILGLLLKIGYDRLTAGNDKERAEMVFKYVFNLLKNVVEEYPKSVQYIVKSMMMILIKRLGLMDKLLSLSSNPTGQTLNLFKSLASTSDYGTGSEEEDDKPSFWNPVQEPKTEVIDLDEDEVLVVEDVKSLPDSNIDVQEVPLYSKGVAITVDLASDLGEGEHFAYWAKEVETRKRNPKLPKPFPQIKPEEDIVPTPLKIKDEDRGLIDQLVSRYEDKQEPTILATICLDSDSEQEVETIDLSEETSITKNFPTSPTKEELDLIQCLNSTSDLQRSTEKDIEETSSSSASFGELLKVSCMTEPLTNPEREEIDTEGLNLFSIAVSLIDESEAETAPVDFVPLLGSKSPPKKNDVYTQKLIDVNASSEESNDSENNLFIDEGKAAPERDLFDEDTLTEELYFVNSQIEIDSCISIPEGFGSYDIVDQVEQFQLGQVKSKGSLKAFDFKKKTPKKRKKVEKSKPQKAALDLSSLSSRTRSKNKPFKKKTSEIIKGTIDRLKSTLLKGPLEDSCGNFFTSSPFSNVKKDNQINVPEVVEPEETYYLSKKQKVMLLSRENSNKEALKEKDKLEAGSESEEKQLRAQKLFGADSDVSEIEFNSKEDSKSKEALEVEEAHKESEEKETIPIIQPSIEPEAEQTTNLSIKIPKGIEIVSTANRAPRKTKRKNLDYVINSLKGDTTDQVDVVDLKTKLKEKMSLEALQPEKSQINYETIEEISNINKNVIKEVIAQIKSPITSPTKFTIREMLGVREDSIEDKIKLAEFSSFDITTEAASELLLDAPEEYVALQTLLEQHEVGISESLCSENISTIAQVELIFEQCIETIQSDYVEHCDSSLTETRNDQVVVKLPLSIPEEIVYKEPEPQPEVEAEAEKEPQLEQLGNILNGNNETFFLKFNQLSENDVSYLKVVDGSSSELEVISLEQITELVPSGGFEENGQGSRQTSPVGGPLFTGGNSSFPDDELLNSTAELSFSLSEVEQFINPEQQNTNFDADSEYAINGISALCAPNGKLESDDDLIYSHSHGIIEQTVGETFMPCEEGLYFPGSETSTETGQDYMPASRGGVYFFPGDDGSQTVIAQQVEETSNMSTVTTTDSLNFSSSEESHIEPSFFKEDSKPKVVVQAIDTAFPISHDYGAKSKAKISETESEGSSVSDQESTKSDKGCKIEDVRLRVHSRTKVMAPKPKKTFLRLKPVSDLLEPVRKEPEKEKNEVEDGLDKFSQIKARKRSSKYDSLAESDDEKKPGKKTKASSPKEDLKKDKKEEEIDKGLKKIDSYLDKIEKYNELRSSKPKEEEGEKSSRATESAFDILWKEYEASRKLKLQEAENSESKKRKGYFTAPYTSITSSKRYKSDGESGSESATEVRLKKDEDKSKRRKEDEDKKREGSNEIKSKREEESRRTRREEEDKKDFKDNNKSLDERVGMLVSKMKEVKTGSARKGYFTGDKEAWFQSMSMYLPQNHGYFTSAESSRVSNDRSYSTGGSRSRKDSRESS